MKIRILCVVVRLSKELLIVCKVFFFRSCIVVYMYISTVGWQKCLRNEIIISPPQMLIYLLLSVSARERWWIILESRPLLNLLMQTVVFVFVFSVHSFDRLVGCCCFFYGFVCIPVVWKNRESQHVGLFVGWKKICIQHPTK